MFFGTPAFAVPTLQALLDSRHRVVGVVSQPDRPRGRGQKPGTAPVKALALERGLPVLQPERLKDAAFLAGASRRSAPTSAWSPPTAASSRRIVIDTPRLGLINVHASLLPRYRGAAPIQRAVMAGDAETGVTIMRIVRELDAGAMFAKVARPIAPDATSGDVERDLADGRARGCSSRSWTRIAAGHRSRGAAGRLRGDLRAEDHARGEPDRLDAVGGRASTTRCAGSTRGRTRPPRSPAPG